MTRRTYIYDPDMDALVEITNTNREPQPRRSDGVQIIRDIEPYRTVASDVASGGAQAVIGSRRRHRAFLRDNGYTEVGNARPVPTPDYIADRAHQESVIGSLKRALAQHNRGD